MLESLFEETGTLAHLESAIQAREALERSVSQTNRRQNSGRASLGSRGNKLRRNMGHGDIANLEEAVGLASQALELTPEDAIDRSEWTNSLGVSLSQRFELSGDLSDLDKAIQAARETIRLTKPSDPSQITWASNLSNRLYKRYCRTGDIKDLAESIQTGRRSTLRDSTRSPRTCELLDPTSKCFGQGV